MKRKMEVIVQASMPMPHLYVKGNHKAVRTGLYRFVTYS